MYAELYRKHLYYKLYRALQDEGLEERQMAFEEDICYVLPIGFFSFRFVHGKPMLIHFVVFKECRSLKNAMALYRTFRNAMVPLGFISFIAFVDERVFFERFIKWVARDKDLKPYTTKNDVKYYHVACRR